MKLTFRVSLLSLAALTFLQPCFANTDPSGDTSAMSELAALAGIATPVMASGSGACLAVGTAHQIVKLVDASGKELSNLTSDGFEIIAENLLYDPSEVHVKANKKEIPLVVRKDYLELNQEVKPE